MSMRSKGIAGRLAGARQARIEADAKRLALESAEDEIGRLHQHVASLEAQLQGAIAQRNDALARMAGAHRALDQREQILDGVRAARDDLRAELGRTRRLLDQVRGAATEALTYYADVASYDEHLAPVALVDGEVEHDGGARAHDALLDLGVDPPPPICVGCGERVPDVDDDDRCAPCARQGARG